VCVCMFVLASVCSSLHFNMFISTTLNPLDHDGEPAAEEQKVKPAGHKPAEVCVCVCLY
jgi:hypothetical protein